jgi:hypothetical protein
MSAATSINDPSLNEIGHYVVTAQPSGSVLSAVKCSFFGDGSVVRTNHLMHNLSYLVFSPSYIFCLNASSIILKGRGHCEIEPLRNTSISTFF